MLLMRRYRLAVTRGVLLSFCGWLLLGALAGLHGMGVRSGFDAGGGGGASIIISALTGALVPDTNNAYDLGSASKRWKDAHLSGSVLVENGEGVFHKSATTGVEATTGSQMNLRVNGTSVIKAEASVIEVNVPLQFRNKIRLLATTATLSSDAFGVGIQAVYTVSAESGTTDDIANITSGTQGQIVKITPASGHTLTIVETGNITAGGSSYVLNDGAMVELWYDGSSWIVQGA